MVNIPKTHPSNSVRRTLKRCGTISAALLLTALGTTLPSAAQSNDPLPEVEAGSDSSELPDDDVRFECQLFNGQYTVMYLPESQPGQAYPWATPTALGGGWTAENRCFTISDRLEAYRPEGLAELQVGTENGYDIVCATTEQIPGLCKIVFTVPPGQNPVATRDLVFENLTLADGGTDTTIVNTYTGSGGIDVLGQIGEALGTDLGRFPIPTARSSSRNSGLNLKPFLDAADGGTGTALSPKTSGRMLNPDRFR